MTISFYSSNLLIFLFRLFCIVAGSKILNFFSNFYAAFAILESLNLSALLVLCTEFIGEFASSHELYSLFIQRVMKFGLVANVSTKDLNISFSGRIILKNQLFRSKYQYSALSIFFWPVVASRVVLACTCITREYFWATWKIF